MSATTAVLCYCLGLCYFALIAVLRVAKYRARFENLPMSGDTLPGGIYPVFLKVKS